MGAPTGSREGTSKEVFGGVADDPPGAPNTSQTPTSASSTGGAQANNATLAAAAGVTTYISGFAVTGAGATAASVITVTVTGTVSGTLNFTLAIPAGAAVGVPALVVDFGRPLAASAPNTAIVVNVPSFGAGNTNASTSAWGFRQ